MDQIKLFYHLFGFIIFRHLNLYSYMQIICISLEYLINWITNAK